MMLVLAVATACTRATFELLSYLFAFTINKCFVFIFFFFNDTATTEIYTLSLHDALLISKRSWTRKPTSSTRRKRRRPAKASVARRNRRRFANRAGHRPLARVAVEVEVDHRRDEERSEEHTSELQSRSDLVCRLLLEKKK